MALQVSNGVGRDRYLSWIDRYTKNIGFGEFNDIEWLPYKK